MPSQITHILAGEEALSILGEDSLRLAVSQAPAFFRLGCQGPDIFYHNQRTRPSGIHFGSLLHKRNYGTMLAAAYEYARSIESLLPRSAALAYLLGVSTHAATDRILHPFIIHFSGRPEPAKPETMRFTGCHAFLERLVDMALLKRYRRSSPESFDIAASMDIGPGHGTESSEALAGSWEAGLRAAFPNSTARDSFVRLRAHNALDDARRFFAITNPVTGGERSPPFARFVDLSPRDRIRVAALLYPPRLPEGLDFMNEEGRSWAHPSGDGRSSRSDGYSLFAEAVEESARGMLACRDFLAEDSGPEDFAAAIGEACLGSCDREGRPSPGNATDPLPLGALLLRWSEELAAGEAEDSGVPPDRG